MTVNQSDRSCPETDGIDFYYLFKTLTTALAQGWGDVCMPMLRLNCCEVRDHARKRSVTHCGTPKW